MTTLREAMDLCHIRHDEVIHLNRTSRPETPEITTRAALPKDLLDVPVTGIEPAFVYADYEGFRFVVDA